MASCYYVRTAHQLFSSTILRCGWPSVCALESQDSHGKTGLKMPEAHLFKCIFLWSDRVYGNGKQDGVRETRGSIMGCKLS